MDKVTISPDIGVLAVLRHLNYRPWYALAEFIDNSLQSFLDNEGSIKSIDGDNYKLRVDIDFNNDSNSIVIADNAGGISDADYSRAFRPAAAPLDTKGLSEFGMGMKSAACWFAAKWSVKTSALGESKEKTVKLDIEELVDNKIDKLDVVTEIASEKEHFTRIVLEDIYTMPSGNTVKKIKGHLTEIYREFIRDDQLEIYFNGECLIYETPKILNVPYFKEPKSESKLWKKDIEFDFGEGLSVQGFAALREKGSTSQAGFSLFRRRRVIQGVGDEKYRPDEIFGSSISFRYQRLFGELHLEGFAVSHTKDGFQWDENEQPFLELLREHLDEDDLPLLKQAEGYRVRENREVIKKKADKAIISTGEDIVSKLSKTLKDLEDSEPVQTANTIEPTELIVTKHEYDIEFNRLNWKIIIEIHDDEEQNQWLILGDLGGIHADPRRINIRISMVHPFMIQFAQSSGETLESYFRIASALAIAQVTAGDIGVENAGTFIRNVNKILLEVFSKNN